MKNRLTEERMEYLREWERTLIAQIKYAATQHSGLDDLVYTIDHNKFTAKPIAGPRVAGLALNAMATTPKLSNLLQKDGGAILQQTLAWRANATPTCRWDAVDLVIEYPWPKRLEDRDIRVTELTQNLQEDARTMRKQGNLWIGGIDQNYETVMLSLTLERGSPHYLSGGDTGSGKTTGMLSAIGQLCACPLNQVIMMDLAKDGLDFRIFNGVANRVFPDTVRTIEQARVALQYAVSNVKIKREGYLIVAIDEIQAVMDDAACKDLYVKLPQLGRSNKIAVMAATQFPTAENTGGTEAKANYGGRIAYRLPGPQSGTMVLGISGYGARVNQLQGHGDCIIRTGYLNPTRVQAAYMTENELLNLKQGPPLFDEWPEVEIENSNDGNSQKSQPFTEKQIAVATMLRSDWHIAGEPTKGYGAGVLKERLIEAGCPLKGPNAHSRLQRFAVNIFKFYQDAGYNLNETGMVMTNWTEVN